MNISKFTQKSLEAVQNTEKLAYEYGNQQIAGHVRRDSDRRPADALPDYPEDYKL
jgi:hypothetical protein